MPQLRLPEENIQKLCIACFVRNMLCMYHVIWYYRSFLLCSRTLGLMFPVWPQLSMHCPVFPHHSAHTLQPLVSPFYPQLLWDQLPKIPHEWDYYGTAVLLSLVYFPSTVNACSNYMMPQMAKFILSIWMLPHSLGSLVCSSVWLCSVLRV